VEGGEVMAHYYVINTAKTYGRVIDAPTSFEARCIVAKATGAGAVDFFALREDLMRPRDWAMWDRIKNK
jgi:hypothetical protein